jgi:hypothetical protein
MNSEEIFLIERTRCGGPYLFIGKVGMEVFVSFEDWTEVCRFCISSQDGLSRSINVFASEFIDEI